MLNNIGLCIISLLMLIFQLCGPFLEVMFGGHDISSLPMQPSESGLLKPW